MSSEEGERSRGHLWAVAVLALAPLLYVLSIGPVAMVGNRMGWDADAVRVAYAPVIWLHDHTPLEKPLEWYVRMWGVR